VNMITTKMIAERAGVSRGTVDRVIHNRPGVRPHVRERILEVIRELNYIPRTHGAQNILKKKKIGVIMQMRENPVHMQIYEGVQTAQKRYKDSAEIMVGFLSRPSAREQVETIQKMVQDGIEALAIAPLDSHETSRLFAELTEENIPVVTFNSDLLGSARMCYVGQDHTLAGKVAGELMGLVCNGQGRVLVNFGSSILTAHVQRLTLFNATLKQNYPGVEVVKTVSNYDGEELSYRLVYDALKADPDINCVYSLTAVAGASRAIRDAGCCVHHIGHDIVPEMVELIKQYPNEKFIDFMIGQHPAGQGILPIKILLDYLILGEKPVSDNMFLPINIRMRVTADQGENGELYI
jgi:LacI family transcriptional regulator